MLSEVQDVGSYHISLVGPVNLINQAISVVKFLPDKNFNTLFRPKKLPPNFDINAPFYAPIEFSFNDNGNSGGYLLEPRSTTFTAKMVVIPVNDAPVVVDNLPNQRCAESSSIFLNLSVSDEDILDFGAPNYIYNVNISLERAAVQINVSLFVKSSDILFRSSRVLVFQGVLRFINVVLSHVEYLPDDMYHTDSIDPDRITIKITDNKGKFDIKPEMETTLEKTIVISSVNNPPLIGRCGSKAGIAHAVNPLTLLQIPGCPHAQALFTDGLYRNNATLTLTEDIWNENLRAADAYVTPSPSLDVFL
jgi:hypothetical protein